MSNTSHKKRDKKIAIITLVGVVALIIISFFVSKKDAQIDLVEVESVEVTQPTAHLKGNLESELKLVEYGDFQCPACRNAAPVIMQLVEDYGDKFQLEFRHYPLRSIHPNAQIASQAVEAAGMQGKFWEMHDLVYDKQAEWSKSFKPTKFFKEYATELGMSAERLEFDMKSAQVKEIVNAQFDEAQKIGLPGTPAFTFNGEMIDLNTFIAENLIDLDATGSEASAE